MTESPPDPVAELVARGAYVEAAARLAQSDDPEALRRAQELYERVWEWAAAAEVARRRGDPVDRLRLLLEGRDLPSTTALLGEILMAAPELQSRAAAVLERKRHFGEAARLREAGGDLAAAAQLYRQAGLPVDGARLDERLGRLREAGLGYEKFLAEEPEAEEAPRAELALGRLLARFGRHDEALRRLQRAERRLAPRGGSDSALAERARRLAVVELLALGYREGAHDLLARLRRQDPTVGTLEELVREEAAPPIERGLLGGRYEVVRLLGSGGMGRVYLARDRLLGRDVAVKVVAPPTCARSRDGWARFVREARAVAAMQHPSLVRVHDFHEELGLLVMEHMAGGTLADHLPGALPPSRVRTILTQVTTGLAAAHVHGVIHRDLKPANVFFSATLEAKLGDFGVAHLQDLGATQTAGFIGTLAYMAPEQITGARLTFACDLYALGVTAFQLLTGRLPFPGPDFVGQHLGETAPALSTLRPGLDPAWDELVGRLLAKDPAARFATAGELLHHLAAIPITDEAPPAAAAATSPTTAPGSPRERYRIEAELAAGPRSRLLRAVDERLGRGVIVEQFAAGFLAGAGAPHLAFLRAASRSFGPHLQRLLAVDVALDRAVFEAPRLPSSLAALGPLEEPRLAELLDGICRALAPLHEAGLGHGGLAEALVIEGGRPLLLLAGHGEATATPAHDLATLRRLLVPLVEPALLEGLPEALPPLAAWCAARRSPTRGLTAS